jgi:Mn-dependent DtxR family transcriptional regulator
MRTLPSDANKVRLMRMLDGKYAFSTKDVARWLKVKKDRACDYVNDLQMEGKIVFSYKLRNLNYYKVVRNEIT